MKKLSLFFGLVTILFLTGCSPFKISIQTAPGIVIPGYKSFRVNRSIQDDKGNDITQEIMENELDRWFLFMEMYSCVKGTFINKGYKYVDNPAEKADFVVDVCFSAFYAEDLSEEEMWDQQPATFLVSRKFEDFFTHFVILSVLSYDPSLGSDEFAVLWEGKGSVSDGFSEIPEEGSDSDKPVIPITGFTLIEMLADGFPNAER